MRKTRKEISKSEIRNVFRQIEKISSQRKPYFQVPQPQGIVEGWVTTGGSAKFDNTLISVSQRKSTLNSKKRTKPTPKKSRLGKGLLVGLVAAVLSYQSCLALAQIDTSVVYTASSTARQTLDLPVSRTETLNPVSESIHDKITRYALKYDVSPVELENIVKCETGATDVNKASTTIRSRYLEGTPRHEKSYGLVQISLRNHPETSYSQAIDPDYALNFLASNWKQHKEWWSCTRILGL